MNINSIADHNFIKQKENQRFARHENKIIFLFRSASKFQKSIDVSILIVLPLVGNNEFALSDLIPATIPRISFCG